MNDMTSPIIFWYRQDLRTHDLPGLAAAAATGRPIIPCYILDDESPAEWKIGAASRWWLHHSLGSLAKDLTHLGGKLILRRGEALEVLNQLAQQLIEHRALQPDDAIPPYQANKSGFIPPPLWKQLKTAKQNSLSNMPRYERTAPEQAGSDLENPSETLMSP